jgi:DNA-binding transcriptional MerR regulator
LAGFIIDTLKASRRLREAGFEEAEADALIATFQEAGENADLATKADLREVAAALRADIRELETTLRAEIREIDTKIRETELRLEAKIEAVRADILTRVFAMIAGAAVINVVAIVAAMIGVAKLLGH